MKSILGFITKNSFINNQAGTVSEFFELSPFSLTYSRTRGEYQHLDFPGDVLHIFKCVDVESGEKYLMGIDQVKETLAILNSVFAYSLQYHYPYNRLDYVNTVQASHHGKIQNLELGAFYPGTSNTLPEWVSWESLTYPDTKVKIWLRNTAFEGQYSDYEIIVVPPIDQLDSFFGNYGSMATTISAITISQTMERAMEFRGEIPESYLRVFEFTYVNKNNTTQRTSVRWPVLVYGKNGDNVDSIKDAIVDFVLKNSTKKINEWEVIFPDLFMRTEFLILPRWDKVSIPNLTDLGALYSSLLDPRECITKAISFWSDVNVSWVESNLSILPFDYKCITALILNGTTNRDGLKDIKTLFSDYIPMGTSMPDFNRMSVNTRNWVLKMVELLKTAETATDDSTIANPMRRVYRNGKLYVCLMYNDINFLVAARSSVE